MNGEHELDARAHAAHFRQCAPDLLFDEGATDAPRRGDDDLASQLPIAAHESPRTTKLYDRTGDEITLDEIERILI